MYTLPKKCTAVSRISSHGTWTHTTANVTRYKTSTLLDEVVSSHQLTTVRVYPTHHLSSHHTLSNPTPCPASVFTFSPRGGGIIQSVCAVCACHDSIQTLLHPTTILYSPLSTSPFPSIPWTSLLIVNPDSHSSPVTAANSTYSLPLTHGTITLLMHPHPTAPLHFLPLTLYPAPPH